MHVRVRGGACVSRVCLPSAVVCARERLTNKGACVKAKGLASSVYRYSAAAGLFHIPPRAAPHTSAQGTARVELHAARLTFAPRQPSSCSPARLRHDRGLGCCRAEAGARLALGSGGGAASLRLMSFRLPCNGRKRDEGSCGARKEWWRPAPLTMAMLARTRPCLLWLDLLW